MPKWRIKNIIMCAVAFSIALGLMFLIGNLNISEGLQGGLMVGVILLTAGSIIFINEKRKDQ